MTRGGSKLTGLVRALVKSGASPDMILAAVEASESEAEAAIEQRRATDRERQQRRRHVMSRDVTVTPRDTPVSDKEKSPTPPKEINSTPDSSLRSDDKKRATRLPDDWKLPATWGQWAVEEGYDEAIIRSQAEIFHDYWCSRAGRDATKTDWLMTWKNWMRKQPKRISVVSAARPPPMMERQEAALRAFNYTPRTTDHDEFAGDTIDIEPADLRAH